MKKTGFGIIGPGKIAHKFAKDIRICKDAFVAGVASKSLKRAKDFANEYGINEYYDNYEELCKSENIDAIYIATTNNYHFENIMLCIRNKKHVLCEKPMVISKEQALTVFNEARINNVFVMEALWSRFLPSAVKVKAIIEEGLIGEIKHISCCFNNYFDYDPKFRVFDKSLGGGVLFDLGVYCLSMIIYFYNRIPVIYSGYGELTKEGVDIQVSANMRFDSGSTADFLCSGLVDGLSAMTIYGTNGNIRLNAPFFACRKVDLLNGSKVIETYEFDIDNGFSYQIDEVVRCINNKDIISPVMTWDHTIACCEITQNLINSFNNGEAY